MCRGRFAFFGVCCDLFFLLWCDVVVVVCFFRLIIHASPSPPQATTVAAESGEHKQPTKLRVGRYGIIHLQLAPESQTKEQHDEINELLLWLMGLCNAEERADKSMDSTIRHLSMIHTYYNASDERRAVIDDEIRKQGIEHGVENMLRIVYRNAKPIQPLPQMSEEMPESEEQAQRELDDVTKTLEGGTPQYSDIIAFMSYHYDPFASEVSDLFIGHVFVAEPYRHQKVGRALLCNLIRSFAHAGVNGDNRATPLFKSDVPAGKTAALKLFMSAGFCFSRQPIAGIDKNDKQAKQPLSIDQAETMDTLIRKCIAAGIENPADRDAAELVYTLQEHYYMYNSGTDSYRMTHVLGCCHTCKSTTVTRDKLLRCAQCHAALYCDKVCQKNDWKPRHRMYCHGFRL